MIYFKDTCRSLNCSLFISNVIIKRRSRLGFTQIHKPRASKRVLAAHPNPRQGFKHLGLVTTPFWLLDLPSTPDHTNSAPQTCTEPHPSPFLLWDSAAAEPLHWGCTVNPKPTFHQGNCIRTPYHCNMLWCVSHQGLGAVWGGGGWLIAVAFALLLSMASALCGQLPSAQLLASEFGHLNW